VAFGESVADIGSGSEGHPVTVALVTQAILGLALAAALRHGRARAAHPDRRRRVGG
jgi:hypothetical protein